MRPVHILTFVLTAILLSAFSLSAVSSNSTTINICGYLYANENCSTSLSNYTVNTAQGSFLVVEVNSNPTFILNGNKFVNDSATITTVLEQFLYTQKYPSSDQIAELNSLLLSFNSSRDTETEFGPAETTCKLFTGMDRVTCVDSRYCSVTQCPSCNPGDVECCAVEYACLSTPLCSQALRGIGSAFNPIIDQYGSSINELDYYVNKVSNDIQLLNSTTPDKFSSVNVVSILGDAVSGTQAIESTATTLQSSTLFYRDRCPDCLGVCPQPAYNLSALDTENAMLKQYQTAAAPIASIGAIANSVANETASRLTFNQTSGTKVQYLAKLDIIHSKQTSIRNRTDEVLSLISDPALSNQVTSMNSKSDEIYKAINDTDFTKADTLITQFYGIAGNIDAMLASNITAPFDNLTAIRKNTTALITEAEWNLEPGDTALLGQLNQSEDAKNSLDSQYVLPLTFNKISGLSDNYSAVNVQVNSILQAKENQRLLQPVSYIGAGTKMLDDIALNAISQATPITYSQRQQLAYATPAIALAGFDLGILAAVAIISVGLFMRFRRVILRKTFVALWAVLFIGLFSVLTVSSVLIYLGSSSSIQSSSYNNFIQDLKTSNNTVVLADISDKDHAASVVSCANSLSKELSLKGKNVLNYTISNFTCASTECLISNICGNSTGTKDACLTKTGNYVMFYLKYSPSSSVNFYSIGVKNGLIQGNDAYFSRCDIANMIAAS